MGKPPAARYWPGNLPDTTDGLIQFLYDELFRIATAVEDYPIGVGVEQSLPGVPITVIPTEQTLFIGETADFDLPGGNWDSLTGEWTVPGNGLYNLAINCLVEPFGSGNKDYSAELRLYVNDVAIWRISDSGIDNLELGASMPFNVQLTRGDVLRSSITLAHTQFSGNVPVIAHWGITSTALE